jgi:hypothetical protein
MGGGNAVPNLRGPNAITESLADEPPTVNCGPVGTQEANFIAPFVLDPSVAGVMLVGAKSLWRSTDVPGGDAELVHE